MAVLQWIALILSLVETIHNHIGLVEASTGIGVCYGMLGDDLPAATEVVNLYKTNGIGKMRLFDPNPAALQALRGKEIDVTLGIRNQDLPTLAESPEAMNSWFATNVEPYLDDIVFDYISVGNEVIPGSLGIYVLPVMHSLQRIIDERRLAGIKVTTVVPASALGVSYPPSSGAFAPEVRDVMRGILLFLAQQGSPLMINVYPYFAYASDPVNIPLDYAQFTATGPVVHDGALSYSNLFDATVDAFLSAMEDVDGGESVDVVVSESGWPSNGNGNLTTPELAGTYNRNFMKHVLSMAGTPKRPRTYIEGYVFAMFNENQKPNGVEQHFGLFQPNMQPVYPMF